MKQIRLASIGLTFFFVVFCSCKKEENIANLDSAVSFELTEGDVGVLAALKNDHEIPIDKAQEEALAIMSYYDDSNKLKSEKLTKRQILNVKTTWHKNSSNNMLKMGTAEQDSIAVYLFNFSNEENDSLGYAIVSGDDRLPCVLSCSNKGTLGDTITNPGLAIFMSNAPDYIDNTIAQYEREKIALLQN